MPAEPELTALAMELSEATKQDAAAIDDILDNAADAVAAILAKYSEVPKNVALPLLSNGRSALASLRSHAQRRNHEFPTPFPDALTQ
jgi:hypothetical protein